MRVVIASRIFMPEPAAASFRLAALADALDAAGAEVTVLTTTTPAASSGDPVAVPESVDVRRARVLRDKAGYVRGYLQYMSFDIPLLLRLLTVRRPDVVVVEPPPTTGVVVRVVCALRRIPYVYYAADVWADAAGNAAPGVIVRLVRGLELWAWRGAAAVLSVSAGVTGRLAEYGLGDTVHEVGNGVDTTQFSPRGPSRNLGGDYFVYAGTASEVHGAAVFVDAFADVVRRHPTAFLVFVGHGAERAELEKRAAALPAGRVIFEPRQSPEAVAQWLRGATASLASVKPGQGYDFAFPTKMYASASCGVPVIYAGIGSGAQLVRDLGAGWATDYEATAVAAAMEAALGHSATEAERVRSAEAAQPLVSIAAVAARAAAVVRASVSP